MRHRGCAGGCGVVLEYADGHLADTADRLGWTLTRRDDGPSDAWCVDCAARRKVYSAEDTTVAPGQVAAAVFMNGNRVGEADFTANEDGLCMGRVHMNMQVAVTFPPRAERERPPPPAPGEELPRDFVERWKLDETKRDLEATRQRSAALAARVDEFAARIVALEGLLNSPELHDFAKALPLEAAHQVVRWGREHDAGKGPEDWLWVIGYLAGKAVASVRAGDTGKALHHVITTAAVCANWHAAIKSTDNRMRPGIDPAEHGVEVDAPRGE